MPKPANRPAADDASDADDPVDTAPAYGHRYCNVRATRPRPLGPGVDADRARAIQVLGNKWLNGTVLSYYFFDRTSDGETVTSVDGTTSFVSWVGGEAQREVVRQGFAAWASIGLGVTFKEVASRDSATVRIGFMPGDGSWSFVGRGVLDIATDRRTMNFGWNLAGDLDTAIHEIGHTLGFEHEHQNPFAGIVWNDEAVYASLARPPNKWNRDKTFFNILRKLDTSEVTGTTWDPDSVMHYPFGAGLIAQPARFAAGLRPAGGLSPRDRSQVRELYPPTVPTAALPDLPLVQSMPLAIAPGQQLDVRLRPTRTRTYEMGTFGTSDSVIALFEEVGGVPKYRAGDDDGGEDRNARLRWRMNRGSTYVLRVRLYHEDRAGETAVMWW